MAFQKKNPPIKVEITIDKFNSIIELLELNSKKVNSKTTEKAILLKDKLMKYSMIRNDENGNITMDIRFYPNEASDIIIQLLEIINIENKIDYYAILKEKRKILTEKNE